MPSAASRADRSIVLVGLMGVGKSTVGRRLAARLGLPFVDADRQIEQVEGMAIADIFDRFGELHFRECERRTMIRLLEEPPQVIAAGGGAFLDEAVRRRILDSGIAVWLDADAATLAARLADSDDRPLLRGRDAAVVLAELAERRGPIYALAHHRIPVGPEPPERAVERIVDALGRAD